MIREKVQVLFAKRLLGCDFLLGLVAEAFAAGARQCKACETLGIDARTIQLWTKQDVGDDRRAGPKAAPARKLRDAERRRILDVANSPGFR